MLPAGQGRTQLTAALGLWCMSVSNPRSWQPTSSKLPCEHLLNVMRLFTLSSSCRRNAGLWGLLQSRRHGLDSSNAPSETPLWCQHSAGEMVWCSPHTSLGKRKAKWDPVHFNVTVHRPSHRQSQHVFQILEETKTLPRQPWAKNNADESYTCPSTVSLIKMP
jgi:hypothetical protein